MRKGLEGCSVLVTRPAGPAAELVAAIEAAGGNAFAFPVLQITPRDTSAVRAEFEQLKTPDIVIFISANAVEHGVHMLRHSAAKFAAIGPATRDALWHAGMRVEIFPEGRYDSEHLLKHATLQDVTGQSVLIVRGDRGRELLARTLRDRGAEVDYLSVYTRETVAPDDLSLAKLRAFHAEHGFDFVIVMSVDSLQAVLEILPEELSATLPESWLVTPSERVIKTALDRLPGMRAAFALAPQADALVDAITQCRREIMES